MPDTTDTVNVCRAGGVAVVQVVGAGSMRMTAAMERFIRQCAAEGDRVIRIDLSRCTMIDSTFMGTLLALHKALSGGDSPSFAVQCPSEPCGKTLGFMKLDMLLSIVTEPEPAPGPWQPLATQAPDGTATQKTIVAAHRELASLPGPTGQTFRKLADRMQAEWDKQQGGQPPTHE